MKAMGQIPVLQEGREYSTADLELMADDIIFSDDDWEPDGAILKDEMLWMRKKREIYTAAGIADPHVQSGMYWRTHPQGRMFHTAEEREADPSITTFYVG